MVTVDSKEVHTDGHLNGEMDETHENGGIIDSNNTTEVSENGNDTADMSGHDTNGNAIEFKEVLSIGIIKRIAYDKTVI